VLPVVRRTEQAMAANEVMNHEYLPVLGLDSFSSAATRMLLGKDNKAIAEGRVRIFHFFLIKITNLMRTKIIQKNCLSEIKLMRIFLISGLRHPNSQWNRKFEDSCRVFRAHSEVQNLLLFSSDLG
jgi:hypothetical protein